MSYCRWSSDNFKCDLYVYKHVNGGWTTHVINNRLKVSEEEYARYIDKMLAEGNASLAEECFEPLNLPHAGETFSDPTLEALKERLLYLRGLGYRFPDYVLERIDREITEGE